MVMLISDIKKKNEQKSNPSEYVFLGKYEQPLLSVKRPFQDALKRAGILDFRFHDLRHTFASHYIMNGGDLMSLKEIGGWNSMKMVERYAHLASDYKGKMVNKLSGKFSGCHPIATSTNIVNLAEKEKPHKSL
jgi:integrase